MKTCWEHDYQSPTFTNKPCPECEAISLEYKFADPENALKSLKDLDVLKWTKELPTQEGWYWNKEINYKPECVKVDITANGEFYVLYDEEMQNVKRFGGEWYGPIEPPEYT